MACQACRLRFDEDQKPLTKNILHVVMSELIECQRFYGLSWGTPIPLFDPPQWSSLLGTTHAPPSVDGQGGWFVVRLTSTDDDGWIYGSAFSHLDSARPGGRASKRGSDQVRRRVWRRLLIVNHEEQMKVVDATDIMAEAASAAGIHPPFSPERRSAPTLSPHSSGYKRSPSLSLSHPRQINHGTEASSSSSSSLIYSPTRSIRAERQNQGSGVFIQGLSLSTTKGTSSGEAIIEALTATIEARRYRVKEGSPSVLQLSKGIISMWNESAKRHGVLRLFPLDPIGLVLAMKKHTEYAASIKQDLIDTQARDGRAPLIIIPIDNKEVRGEGEKGGEAAPPATLDVEPYRLPPGDHVTPNALLADPCDTQRLISELLVATDYSRAAYGYAMAAGHMKSIPDLIKMISGSAFFNPVSGASAEANNEAIETITGIPTADLLKSEWRNSPFRPCHFLAVDRLRRRLVLSIRGSLEAGDLYTDLEAQSQPFSLLPSSKDKKDGDLRPGGEAPVHHVHKGLLSAALFVAASTSSALVQATEGEYRGWPLIVSGHSLGAGVASLLTLMLRNRQDYEESGLAVQRGSETTSREEAGPISACGSPVNQMEGGFSEPPPPSPLNLLTSIPLLPRSCHIYSICIAPPPTLSDSLARESESFVLSLVHGMDFVSRLSHHSIELALMDMVQSSPAVRLAENLRKGLEGGKAAVSALSEEGKAALAVLSKEGREALATILGPNVFSTLESEGAAVLSALGDEGRAALMALGEEGKAAWSILASGIKESVKAIKDASSRSRRTTRNGGEGGGEGEGMEEAEWEFRHWLKRTSMPGLSSSPPSSSTRPEKSRDEASSLISNDGVQLQEAEEGPSGRPRTFSTRWDSFVGTMTGWLEDVFEITEADPLTPGKDDAANSHHKLKEEEGGTTEEEEVTLPRLGEALEKEVDATIEDLQKAASAHVVDDEGEGLVEEQEGEEEVAVAAASGVREAIKEADKMATKLFLPGVILWMFKEDSSPQALKSPRKVNGSSSNEEMEVGIEDDDGEGEITRELLGSPLAGPSNRTSKTEPSDGGVARLCLAKADRDCFNKLALVDSCITDHMPDSYKSLLVELKKGATVGFSRI